MDYLTIALILYAALVINMWRWSRNWSDSSLFWIPTLGLGFIMFVLTVLAPMYEKVEDITSQVRRGSMQTENVYTQVVVFNNQYQTFSYIMSAAEAQEQNMDSYPVKLVTAHSYFGLTEEPKIELRK